MFCVSSLQCSCDGSIDHIYQGIMGILVHAFFAWRLFILSKSKILTAIVLLLATVAGGECWSLSNRSVGLNPFVVGSIAVATMALLRVSFTAFWKLPFGPMWLVGSALVDTLVAVSLTLLLRKVCFSPFVP
jgi:hypothetical protein